MPKANKLVVLTLLCSACFMVVAQPTFRASAALAMTTEHISDLQDVLLHYATESNEAKLNRIMTETEISVTADIAQDSVAFAEHTEGRTVELSRDFVRQLADYIERNPQLTNEQTTQDALYLAALHDVILHEIGHHMLEAFYNDYTPPRFIPGMELAAQEWAEQMKINIEVDDHGVGRLLVLLTLYDTEIQLMSMQQSSGKHRSIGANIDYECLSTYSDLEEAICVNFWASY